MKTDSYQPQPNTAGLRYPRIRVSHSDPYRDQPTPSYLDTFGVALEKAFLLAFQRTSSKGGAI